MQDNELWASLVVLAAVPPALAILPFAYVLGGDMYFPLTGIAGTYLAALAIMPLIVLIFLGTDAFDPPGLLLILSACSRCCGWPFASAGRPSSLSLLD